MAKRPKTDTLTPTNDAPGAVLSLAALQELETSQRVDLYVTTEAQQRLGFLLQGKILFTLGDQGLELLRAAGIKPGSLYNARRAEWVLRTFTGDDAMEDFELNGTPFTEATFDGLTLLQCELLQKAFTRIGTVLNRPSRDQARTICAAPEWDDNLECWFENGCTLAELAQQEQDAAAELAAERQRQQDMAAQIAEQERIIAEQRTQLAAAPPASPVINTTPPAEEAPGDATETPETPENVVAFTSTDAIEEEGPVETTEPAEDEDADTVVIPPEPQSEVTHVEIAEAVVDANAAIAEHHAATAADIAQHICDLAEVVDNGAADCPLEDLTVFAANLEAVLTTVRAAIAAKAAPQNELPKLKKRGKKLAAAA